MKTLYVSDLDGTLLGNDSRVSDTTASILADIIADGGLFTVATARTPATVVPLLGAVPMNVPAIVMTGAAMWDWKAGAYTDVQALSPGDWHKVIGVCRDLDVHPFIYTLPPGSGVLQVYHPSRVMNSAEFGFMEQRRHLRLKKFHVGTAVPAMAETSTLLFYGMGDTARVDTVASVLARETGCTVSSYPDIFNPGISSLEVFAPGVTKASAIRRLAARLGCGRTVVFGDNLNDIPMMEAADVAVAVGNALPQVKEAADRVISPNHTDAVAREILRMEGMRLKIKD